MWCISCRKSLITTHVEHSLRWQVLCKTLVSPLRGSSVSPLCILCESSAHPLYTVFFVSLHHLDRGSSARPLTQVFAVHNFLNDIVNWSVPGTIAQFCARLNMCFAVVAASPILAFVCQLYEEDHRRLFPHRTSLADYALYTCLQDVSPF